MAVLSRLDEDLFLKDTRYACTYFFEHEENFKDMLLKLMSVATLQKVVENAASISLQYNEQTGAIDKDYSNSVIKPAYHELARICTMEGKVEIGQNENLESGKLFLFSFMQNWFEVLHEGRERKGVTFGQLFGEPYGKQMTMPYRSILLGREYDEEDCENLFLPQLLILFLRILNIYDNALQGKYVDEFLQHKQTASRTDKVENAWQTFANDYAASEELCELAYQEIDAAEIQAKEDWIKREKQLKDLEAGITPSQDNQVKIGRSSERWVIDQSERALLEEIQQEWSEFSNEFVQKWMKMTEEDRVIALQKVRIFLHDLSGGTLQNALLYCPELNPITLAKEKSTDGEEVKDPLVEIPTISLTPSFIQICVWSISQACSKNPRNDPFLKTLAARVGTEKQRKTLPLIFAARRRCILAFCLAVVLQILNHDMEIMRLTVPGAKAESLFGDDDEFPSKPSTQNPQQPSQTTAASKRVKIPPPKPKIQEVDDANPNIASPTEKVNPEIPKSTLRDQNPEKPAQPNEPKLSNTPTTPKPSEGSGLKGGFFLSEGEKKKQAK